MAQIEHLALGFAGLDQRHQVRAMRSVRRQGDGNNKDLGLAQMFDIVGKTHVIRFPDVILHDLHGVVHAYPKALRWDRRLCQSNHWALLAEFNCQR
jgi:hypothetical protein